MDITPESPLWVGAWWIGFILSGILGFLLCIPLFGYPSKLERPSSAGRSCSIRKRHKIEHDISMQSIKSDDYALDKLNSEINHEVMNSLFLAEDSKQNSLHKVASKTSSIKAVRDFGSDLVQVLSNKAFMFLSLSAAIFSTLVAGFSTFGPKFIESQLGKSAADAANLFGYVCIPAGASGMLIGAFLMVGLKMSYKSTLQMCIAVSTFSLLAHFVLILDCKDPDIAGITVPYPSNLSQESVPFSNLTLLDSCNTHCNCLDVLSFTPVCGADDVTYYSPCHAGCSVYHNHKNMYSNCACISQSLNDSVKSGICPRDCKWETLILFSLFIIILSTFMCTIPGVDISLRCFPDHQRSLAIGVQWILIRTLGTIPGPILFGAVIDGACFLMGKANCNSKGSCLLYRNSDLSSSFLVLSFTYKVAGIIFLCLALFYVRTCIHEGSSPPQTSSAVQNGTGSLGHAGREQADPCRVSSSS